MKKGIVSKYIAKLKKQEFRTPSVNIAKKDNNDGRKNLSVLRVRTKANSFSLIIIENGKERRKIGLKKEISKLEIAVRRRGYDFKIIAVCKEEISLIHARYVSEENKDELNVIC